MIPIFLSSLIGAPVAAAVFASHGAIDALLAAPLGGSLAAIVTAAFFANRRSNPARRRLAPMTPPQARFSTTWRAAAHG